MTCLPAALVLTSEFAHFLFKKRPCSQSRSKENDFQPSIRCFGHGQKNGENICHNRILSPHCYLNAVILNICIRKPVPREVHAQFAGILTDSICSPEGQGLTKMCPQGTAKRPPRTHTCLLLLTTPASTLTQGRSD